MIIIIILDWRALKWLLLLSTGDAPIASVVGVDFSEHHGDHGAAQGRSQWNDSAKETSATIPTGQRTDWTHGTQRYFTELKLKLKLQEGWLSPMERESVSAHFSLPWVNRSKCYMDGKRIQCLSNALQHVPIYLQPFPSNSTRKFQKFAILAHFLHILASLGTPLGQSR